MPSHSGGDGLRPALLLAGAITLARMIYLIALCPYHLVEDEAQYWVWSRYLDWSYYSKGPGVAWAIAASTGVFGHAEWAVRLPTVLLSGLGGALAAVFARDLARYAPSHAGRERFPAYAACCVLLAPALQMTGILMTIDGSYVACWIAACWFGWRAMMGRAGWWAWLGLGAALAIGFLFKYTILLLPPGLVVFAIFARRDLQASMGAKGKLFVSLMVAALGLVPVLVWNAQQGWPTVRHLLGHLGVRGGDMPVSSGVSGGVSTGEWSPVWSIELVAMQAGMYGPWLMLGAWAAVRAWRRRGREHDRAQSGARWTARLFLICCAAPIMLFYLGVSLIAEPEGNWPMAGNITLLILGAWLGAECVGLAQRSRAAGVAPERDGRGFRWLWRGGMWYAAVGAVLLHASVPIADSLNRLTDLPPVRSALRGVLGREPRPIVLGRLMGAPQMAEDVERLLRGLRAYGSRDPFVITQHYGRASQLTFYLRDRPPVDVLCAMAYTGGRKSQFDIWAHTNLKRAELRGRDAVILSNDRPEVLDEWRGMFERVEPAAGSGADGRLAGEHKRDRLVFIGRGYRGPAS